MQDQVSVFEEQAAADPALAPAYQGVIAELEDGGAILVAEVARLQEEINRVEDLGETVKETVDAMLAEADLQLVKEAEQTAGLSEVLSESEDLGANSTQEQRRAFLEKLDEFNKRMEARATVSRERAALDPGLAPGYQTVMVSSQTSGAILPGAAAQQQDNIDPSAGLSLAISNLVIIGDSPTQEQRPAFLESLDGIFQRFEESPDDANPSEALADILSTPEKRQRLNQQWLELEEATKIHREAGNPFARVGLAVEEAKKNVEQALDQVSTPVGHSLVQLNCGGTTISTETKPDGSYILSGNIRQGVDCSLLMVDLENKVFARTGVALRASSITPTVDLIVAQPLKEIVIGDRVEGRLEEAGELDMYTLDAAPKQEVFFDLQSQNGLSQVIWQLLDSNGDQVFSQRLYEGDAGSITLELGGTYILVVDHQGLNQSGTYRLQVWDVPAPNKFAIAIGDVISDGRPGPGAGNIETPGVFDGYTFDAAPGQEVFFDLQGQTALRQLNWQLLDRNGDRLFLRDMYRGDAGTITLELGGTYTLWVGQKGEDETGTYQFQLVAK